MSKLELALKLLAEHNGVMLVSELYHTLEDDRLKHDPTIDEMIKSGQAEIVESPKGRLIYLKKWPVGYFTHTIEITPTATESWLVQRFDAYEHEQRAEIPHFVEVDYIHGLTEAIDEYTQEFLRRIQNDNNK